MKKSTPAKKSTGRKAATPKRKATWDESEFAKDVASRVIAFRETSGITQTELGNLVNMKQPAIARLEKGDIPPTIATLARLSSIDGLDFQIDIIDGSAHVVE